ncbi:MAG: PaaI family thioesterase [Desulfonatronovibrionaceae bacterium]
MQKKPIQHQYADELCHCYGCGRLNPEGLGIKSVWDGREAVARFTPRFYHIAIPGYVYGGLLASLVDCHGVGTAAAAAAEEAGEGAANTLPRYVTAALHIYFLKPTPLGPELELRGRLKERKKSKIVVEVEIYAQDEIKVKGEVVAAPMPRAMR